VDVTRRQRESSAGHSRAQVPACTRCCRAPDMRRRRSSTRRSGPCACCRPVSGISCVGAEHRAAAHETTTSSACAGSALASVRERFRYSCSTARRHWAAHGRPRVRGLADRVIVPVQTSTSRSRVLGRAAGRTPLALGAARAEPWADGGGHAVDDARQPHAIGQDVRARSARSLPDLVVRHGDPRTCASARRRATACRDPPRPPQRRGGGVLRAGEGGGCAWLARDRGGQRTRRDPVGVGGGGAAERGAVARLPVELISPNPKTAAPALSDRILGGARRFVGRARVLQPVLVRPRPGGGLRAGGG